MIFIKKNGQIVRADGKDLREVVVVVSASSSSEVITGKEVPVLTEEQFTQAYNNVVDGKVVYIASENDEIFVIKQVNEESGNPVIYFDYYNSHILRYELAENEVEITAKEYGGVGAVVSVNGKAGVVVLNASDLLATNQATIQANLERIDGLIDDANSDIEDLQDEVAEVRDIAQAKTNSYVVSLLADITGTQDEDGNFTSVSAITDVDLSTLKIGDNIFVVDTEAPDFWVSAISPVVKLNKLQTEKIDIENYYTKDEVDELLEDKADVGDLANYVDLSSTQTITGQKTFNNDIKLANNKSINYSDAWQLLYSTALYLKRSGVNKIGFLSSAMQLYNYNLQLNGSSKISDGTNEITVAKIAEKSTTQTIADTTYSGSLTSNKNYVFSSAITSLNIQSLTVAVGDEEPYWRLTFKTGSSISVSFTETLKWVGGTPTFEANTNYVVIITKAITTNEYIATLGEF